MLTLLDAEKLKRSYDQNQAHVKEAAQAVRDWTFEHTPFLKVYSYMKKANVASSATARACGMRFAEEYLDEEGEVTAVYRISRAEWEKRPV